MKQLPENRSTEHFLEDLYFLEATLSTQGERTRVQTQDLEEVLNAENTLTHDFRLAFRDYMKAQGLVVYCDTLGDALIGSFATTVLLSTGNNRDSQLYKKYFKMPPSALSKMPYLKEIEWFNQTITFLESEENPNLSARKQELVEFRDRFTAALTDRSEKRAALNVARNKILEWKETANRVRSSIFAALVPLAPTDTNPIKWANSFFKPAGTTSTSDEEEPPAEETPATT